MTRPITDIYRDLLDLLNENYIPLTKNNSDNPPISFYSDYSGDSFIVSSNFLSEMHRLLIEVMNCTTKTTFSKPYASSKIVVFNSTWWDVTAGQRDEIDEYFKLGYGTNVLEKQYNVDDNNQLIQSHALSFKNNVNGSPVIFNSELISPNDTNDDLSIALNGQFNDRYEWSDFTAVTNGRYFDPSIARIETYIQLDDWLDAYDSILIELKRAKFGGEYNTGIQAQADYHCNPSVAINETSDLYEVDSSYSQYDWSDDETGDSGSVVEQDVVFSRVGNTVNSKQVKVYSEDLSYNVDDGQGGYTTITLSKSKDGVTFGDDLAKIHSTAKSTFIDTQTYTDISHYRNNSVQSILGNDYFGGTLDRNGDGFFRTNDKAFTGKSDLNKKEVGFEFVDYDNYLAKAYTRWTGTDTEQLILAGINSVYSITRDGYAFSESFNNFSVTAFMIDIEVEGSYNMSVINAIDKSLLNSRTEIVDLSPPNLT